MSSERKPPRCYYPWTGMALDSTGQVVPCCYWANGAVGNVNENTVEEIWNNQKYQQLRRAMAAGDLQSAGCANCYGLRQAEAGRAAVDMRYGLELSYDRDCDDETPPSTEYAKNIATLKREVAEGREILSAKPTIVTYVPTRRCNIRCTHCFQESTRTSSISREQASAEVAALAPYVVRLIAGGGEPLILPTWREFLEDFDSSINPYLDFSTVTNATIVTEKTLEGLSRFKHLSIYVSLDGIGEVFERVRVGANFAKVRDNIRRLKSVVDRTKSSGSTITFNVSVMKSTILDLPNIVRFCMVEEVAFELWPVHIMPPDESLVCFNDPARDMRGWAEALNEAKMVSPDDYALRGDCDLIESMIPFDLADIPHHRVTVRLPRQLIESAAAQNAGQRLVAYVFKRGQLVGPGGPAPYWASIRDDYFEVSLPAGEYCINISTKWANAGYLEAWRFAVDPGVAGPIDVRFSIENDGNGLVSIENRGNELVAIENDGDGRPSIENEGDKLVSIENEHIGFVSIEENKGLAFTERTRNRLGDLVGKFTQFAKSPSSPLHLTTRWRQWRGGVAAGDET